MARWVDVNEASLVLGVSVDTIKRRARRGEIPAKQEKTKSGFKWFIEIESESVGQSEAPTEAHKGQGEVEALKLLVSELQKDKQLLWDEVEARRREIGELHVLLQEAQRQNYRALLPGQEDAGAIAGAMADAVAAPRQRRWWRFWVWDTA